MHYEIGLKIMKLKYQRGEKKAVFLLLLLLFAFIFMNF